MHDIWWEWKIKEIQAIKETNSDKMYHAKTFSGLCMFGNIHVFF